MTCPLCFSFTEAPDDIFVLHSSWFGYIDGFSFSWVVRSAANRQCTGCTILKEAVEKCAPDVALASLDDYRFVRGIGRSLRLKVSVRGTDSESADSWPVEIDIYHPKGARVHPASTSAGIKTDSNYTSHTSFAQVLAWIWHCNSHHDECKVNTQIKTLPHRVLRLGKNVRHVNLHISSPGEFGDYACLSHCWGSVQPLTTTKSTLADFQSRIEVNQLPRKFQDAIVYTRKLGLQYLWIDSLCIVQDDTEDWQRESARMADIYENAYITIAATASKDGSGGLFRGGVTYGVASFKYKSAEGKRYSLFARRHIDHHPLGQPLISNNNKTPLLFRGWVLQERYLSPRVLHFTAQELWWECNHLVDCQCGEASFLAYRSVKSKVTGAVGWGQLVETFTALNFTFEQDLLPDLSGVAKHFAHKRLAQLDNPGTYLAGLWRNDMPGNLFWYVARGGDCGRRPLQCRAPSWCWASVNGRVEFCIGPLEPLVDIVNVHCEPRGIDPTGAVSGGYLVIRGGLQKALLKRESAPPTHQAWSSHTPYTLQLSEHPSMISLPSVGGGKSLLMDFDVLQGEGGCNGDRGVEVWLLPLAKHSQSKTSMALLLRCVSENGNTYERIGAMEFYGWEFAYDTEETRKWRQFALTHIFGQKKTPPVFTIMIV